MKIYSVLQIGNFHTNHCEDFLVHELAGSDQRMVAVLDGCTMGTESVFASVLFGKILRNISKKCYYQDFINKSSETMESRLKEMLRQLFKEVKSIKNQLGLDTSELLSTLILGLIDEKQGNAEFLTIGDGLIHIDNRPIEYEQEDRPDYLGYHLGENFDIWYDQQDQKLSIPEFKDLSICTDGIFSFKNLQDKNKQMSEQRVISFFLEDLEFAENDNFLERKVRYLDSEMNHVVTDDLAIIRVLRD